MSSRSNAPITQADLLRMGMIASQDMSGLFGRELDLARLYSDPLFAVALCVERSGQAFLSNQNKA